MTTRLEWAVDFLAYAGWEASVEKTTALVAQASAENGRALSNPLDTTEPAPGATDYNSAGVKNYPTLEAGYAATLATFRNGRYPVLLSILADPAGGSAMTYASSSELSIWGTGPCVAQVEEIQAGDPRGLRATEIAGGVGGSPPPSPTSPGEPTSTADLLKELESMPALTNGGLVRYAYRFALHREADEAGYATFVEYLDNGGTFDQVLAGLQDSPEGQAVIAAERKALGLG